MHFHSQESRNHPYTTAIVTIDYSLITAGVPLIKIMNLDALSQAELAGDEVRHILHQAALISIEHKPTFLSVTQRRRVESKPNTNVNHLDR